MCVFSNSRVSRDLDLDPMTSIYEPGLDSPKTYVHTKMKKRRPQVKAFKRSSTNSMDIQTHAQTDGQMGPNALPQLHLRVVTRTSASRLKT